MNLCKDCKHQITFTYVDGLSDEICTYLTINPQYRDGDRLLAFAYESCKTQRKYNSQCGPDARYFEPREPHTPQKEQR